MTPQEKIDQWWNSWPVKPSVNESYYENDDIMANFGRTVIDQYVSWCGKHGRPVDLRGWPSFIQGLIENSEIID